MPTADIAPRKLRRDQGLDGSAGPVTSLETDGLANRFTDFLPRQSSFSLRLLPLPLDPDKLQIAS